MALVLTPELQIADSEFELTYVRSSGPGGQNVNKVNSKVTLRWNAYANKSLPVGIRARILLKLNSRLTGDGDLIISSDRFRDQIRNRTDCFEKFQALLVEAMKVPKNRKKTRPSFSSQRKAREGKTRHSEKKKGRKVSTHFD